MYPNLKEELESMLSKDFNQVEWVAPAPPILPVCALVRPSNIFPPEVWQLILRKVDTRSLHNVSQTSRALRELLEGAKPIWRFQLVLPLLLPYLGINEALTLRLVCQHWMNSLDDHLKNKNCMGNRLPRSVTLTKLTFPIDLSNRKTVQKWTTRLQKYPDFQCIGWSVEIKSNRLQNYWVQMTAHLNDLSKLLKLFGPQILSMDIAPPTYSGGSSSNDQYLMICGILRLCPNLQKLKIGQDKRTLDFWSSEIEDSEYPIYNWACINTLPCLPHLKSLELLDGLWTSIKTIILNTYGWQVTQLRANVSMGYNYPRLDETLQRFTNVAELSIETNMVNALNVVYNTLEYNPNRYEIRSRSEIFGWRLETLLELASEMTLIRLSVTNPKDTNQELVDSENPILLRRRIRSVKFLKFSDMKGIPSFNFLLCFPSLEEIHLEGRYPNGILDRLLGTKLGVPQKVAETVEIRKFLYEPDENTMYRSNVWILLPALKKFVFEYELDGSKINVSPGQRKVFTRSGWIDYRQVGVPAILPLQQS